MTHAITTKVALRMLAGAIAARPEPTATPAIDGSAQRRITSESTNPRISCVWYERSVVGTMMAKDDVPMHNCMRMESRTPRRRNTSNRTGTMTAPRRCPIARRECRSHSSGDDVQQPTISVAILVLQTADQVLNNSPSSATPICRASMRMSHAAAWPRCVDERCERKTRQRATDLLGANLAELRQCNVGVRANPQPR